MINFNSEFSYIEVWFTDQNSKSLEIEDKINITLIFNGSMKSKNEINIANIQFKRVFVIC